MTDTSKIVRNLLKHYPDPKIALRHRNPLQLLVATILSAQCTDARVNEVTRTLFKKYRRATDYARADPAAFEQEIHSTGFYKNKARMIRACCRELVERFDGKVPHTLAELVSLPGVGRKTANLVLGSAFGQSAIAVDTHVLRVSQRLGLTRAKTAERAEQDLMASMPRGQWTRFTLAAILHGREVCTARKPNCPQCPLRDDCTWRGKS